MENIICEIHLFTKVYILLRTRNHSDTFSKLVCTVHNTYKSQVIISMSNSTKVLQCHGGENGGAIVVSVLLLC